MPTLSKIIVLFWAVSIAAGGFAAQVIRKAGPPHAAGTAQQSEVDEIAKTARGAYDKEDWEDAIRGYEKLVKLAANIAEYHLNLGIARYSAGRCRDAVQPLRQALKLKPGLGQAHLYLGVSLGATGQCREALPYLRKDLPRVTGQQLKRDLALSGVRCAVALSQLDDAIDFIRVLNRDFPNDPEVLYRTVHVYSDLSTRASQELLYKAPSSYQVRQLNAEALETQGKWEEAAEEYRKILEQNPRLPGIHYRLARLILSAPTISIVQVAGPPYTHDRVEGPRRIQWPLLHAPTSFYTWVISRCPPPSDGSRPHSPKPQPSAISWRSRAPIAPMS